jgi:hypothetical protein
MQVYRLEPLRGAERHHYWDISIVPPVPVWVRALSPHHARQRLQRAALNGDLAHENAATPWIDTALVRCIEDNSQQVPSDVALIGSGKITLKLVPFVTSNA